MRPTQPLWRRCLLIWIVAVFLAGCAAPAAPPPTPTLTPADTPAPAATRTPRPTGTPPPTLTATPTATPAPPTATRAPGPTSRPTLDVYGAAETAAPAPPPPRAVAAVPELLEPGVDGSTLADGTVFRWAWPGEALREDEYFQPQLLYNGAYYGVVPPTKGFSAAVDPTVRMVLPGVAGYAWVEVTEETLCCDDYADPSTCRRCTVVVGRERSYDRADWTPLRVEWAVAVVQWDGVDPARIGPVVARSAPRPIRV